jgi:hypothetical protein
MKKNQEILRQKFLTDIIDFFSQKGEEVLRVKSNEIALPTIDKDDNEEYVVITVKVPNGTKDEAYNGYEMAESYELHKKEMQEKKEKQRKLKTEKIERDKKFREQKKIDREKAKTN